MGSVRSGSLPRLRYRRRMPGFDLHTHSTFSDGTLDPEQVVELAVSRDLAGIALTDHDNTGGVERARAAAKGGSLTVLLGCELSAEHDGSPVHVLGYGFDPDEPAFAAKRAWIAEGRVGRARRMVERLRQLGAPVELERVKALAGGGAIGRPHIARAMVEAGVVEDIDAAFSADWIGTGGRAYLAKDAVTPVEAVELIHGAGGVAVLAHPSVHAGASAVPEPVIRAMAAAGLDGLEVDHPDQPPADRARWRALAAELGLETTGASDCHGALFGYRMGSERTPEATVDRLLARGPG
ncbi:MAG: phosphatase [Actinomycetia bacterium]|jgi:3',5'-nucleoside bisphosphate phosphatase|nr:phosphatase [Actinomycetes bacterium]